MSVIQLVKANIDDSELLFFWANDDDVRKNSFNTDKIIYENHLEWFKNKLCSEGTFIYILKENYNPIGVVRLEKNDNESMIISYSIDKKHRGKGHGTELLGIIKEKFLEYNLIGKVKKDNISSIKAFKNAGYFMKEKLDCFVFYSKGD